MPLFAPDFLSEQKKPHFIAPKSEGVPFFNFTPAQNADKQAFVLILQGTDLETFRKIIQYMMNNGMVDFSRKEELNHSVKKSHIYGINTKSMTAYSGKLTAYVSQPDGFPVHENKQGSFPKNKFLEQVNNEIEAHLDDENFRAAHIARKLSLCEMQLHRKLKKFAQLSPANYIRKYRLFKSRTLLKDESLSVTEVCFMVGFRSLEYFSRSFKKEFGVCPSDFTRSEI